MLHWLYCTNACARQGYHADFLFSTKVPPRLYLQSSPVAEDDIQTEGSGIDNEASHHVKHMPIKCMLQHHNYMGPTAV